MKRATLSVVIPLYNHPDVVVRAIDSVLQQTRAPDEVVVVDDCSTDDSAQVIERIAAANSSVRLIRSEKNQGTPRATNKGFEAARGDYVYGLSADDFVMPGFFARAMPALERHPNVGLTYGDFLTVTQGREVLERSPSLPPVEAYYAPDELSDVLYGDILEARGAIFERNALLSCGGFIHELEEMSDWYLGLAVAFRYGLYYQPGICHAKRVDFTSYALKRQASRKGLQEKIRRVITLLSKPENHDLLPHFARSAAFMHFGIDAAEVALQQSEDWGPIHDMLLREPLAQYMAEKKQRAKSVGRTRNRPHFSRPTNWQKYVCDYTPEFLRPRVAGLVDEWKRESKRVVVYGAGEHTVALFKLTNLADADIVAIADRATGLHGEVQYGLAVVAPEAIAALKPDVVLISSAANQDEIYAELLSLEALGTEVVRLYGDNANDQASTASRPASNKSVRALAPSWLVPHIEARVQTWNRQGHGVILYGAGEETSSLFKWTNIADANLVAIAEPVGILQGERLWNLETIAPEAIAQHAVDTILVCNPDATGQIRRELAPLEQAGVHVEMIRPEVEAQRATQLRATTRFATPAHPQLAE
ncbi:MAG: glycosyltransferase involved in cell wall biosynthesis [Myxococcota bacterium]